MVNTARIELWPSHLLKAKSNRDARLIARSDWLLRRKSDGRYLAALRGQALTPLTLECANEPGIDSALQAVMHGRDHDWRSTGDWCAESIAGHLDALDVPEDYGAQHQLNPIAEPLRLHLAGRDRYRRPLWLQRDAARAWQSMRSVARRESVSIEAISAYRSIDYQRGIFDRKLARGQSISEILRVNAAPGFSEHHSGQAIDIGTPGEPAAEESFETTDAFLWLENHAPTFGFQLSYPRDNPHGVVYEPWHWRWSASTKTPGPSFQRRLAVRNS